jgi:hypothetical protein
MKLSKWFPGKISPVRLGVYQVFWFTKVVFAFWDGYSWHVGAKSPLEAVLIHHFAAKLPIRWRGLAEDPSK